MRQTKIFARAFLLVFLFSLLCPVFGGLPFADKSALAAGNGKGDGSLEESGPSTPAVSDPLEKPNRAVFSINEKLYFYGLKPVGIIYAAYLPTDLRVAIRRGFYNLATPVRFLNTTLQGKFDAAGTEAARLVINSTLGFAGFYDIAKRDFNLEAPPEEDFGQTLGVWGVKPGIHVMLPLLGPSNLRDIVGLGVDAVTDPLYWLAPWEATYSMKAGRIVNRTSLQIGEYEDFKKSALDPYVSMREAYHQYRNEQIAK